MLCYLMGSKASSGNSLQDVLRGWSPSRATRADRSAVRAARVVGGQHLVDEVEMWLQVGEIEVVAAKRCGGAKVRVDAWTC